MKNKKLYVESLGCPKNRVDTEVFLGTFAANGWVVTHNLEEASLIILNTCGFIEDARKESLERFFDLVNQKNKDAKIVMAGCLPQLYPEIGKELPEADFVTGIDVTAQMAQFIEKHWGEKTTEVIDNPQFIYNSAMQRTLTLSPFSAYVKVADGCDNCCSYCAIPLIRGSFRDRAVSDIEKESLNLVSMGVKELVLIAQDTTAYGKGRDSSIEKLLTQLLTIKGDFRIRLMYLYPSRIRESLLKLIASEKRIHPYFEIPLQHINDTVLESMNRHYRKADVFTALNMIDKYFGTKAVTRTSFITGFPAEKKEHFNELLDFIDEAHFDYAGIFSYSKEERTKAANYRKLPLKTMEERIAQAKERAALSMEKRLKRFIGQKLEILFEEIEEGTMLSYGRGYHQAPEIDGITILTNVENEKPGQFLNVKITERDGIDFIGEIIKH